MSGGERSADDLHLTMEEDIEELVQTLEDDLRIMRRLKEENRKIRRTNEKLRSIITELIKEAQELKQEAEGEYEYDFSRGWKERSDLAAEEIEEMPADEVEDQLMKIRSILTGDDDGK